jgi:hypothetical protein
MYYGLTLKQTLCSGPPVVEAHSIEESGGTDGIVGSPAVKG